MQDRGVVVSFVQHGKHARLLALDGGCAHTLALKGDFSEGRPGCESVDLFEVLSVYVFVIVAVDLEHVVIEYFYLDKGRHAEGQIFARQTSFGDLIFGIQ